MYKNIKKNIIINLIIFFLAIINMSFINQISKEKIKDYSTMIASKITKYVINNAYVREKVNYYAEDIYDIIKDDSNEIKNIVYDAGVINDLINSITERIYNMFNMLEYGDLKKINIRENILTTNKNDKEGIVLEVPTGIIFDNYLLASLGPSIPVKLSLTGEFESYISSDVVEYGINNAMVTININIKISEQITMPFITEKITVENKIPIFMSLVNGEIPNYYIGGFTKNSNIY
ncbi:MAG: sporulation protein YunB [Bacilli bacterium]|nr:sporulation protein YunB [Bacilli bacterium]